MKYRQEKVPSLSWFPSLNGPDEPPSWSSWWTAGLKSPHHHQARETLYPRQSGPSPDFWTCSPCVSHWHTSPDPWPSNPLPAKICKAHKYCHDNKHPNKRWFYSFGNEYGCPLPRAWTVLTSLLPDLLSRLLVEKKSSSSGSRDTVSSSIWALSRLLDLLSLGLSLAHLAQVLSREQTHKQALILQFWQ